MNSSKQRNDSVVYSTEHGRMCPGCQKPQTQCCCTERKKELVQGDGKVRVRRETKGRAGKTISSITGLPLTKNALSDLLSDLKRTCGCGGALKEGVIELQGDHVEVILQELLKRGFSAKRAGG